MNYLKVLSTAFFSILIAACNHPIEIIGDGDVTSASGTRFCYLEDYKAGKDNCTKNTVVGAYAETYYATPRDGWSFDKWEGCQSPASNACSFAVPGDTVIKAWGLTAPPIKAVFVNPANQERYIYDRSDDLIRVFDLDTELFVRRYSFRATTPVPKDPYFGWEISSFKDVKAFVNGEAYNYFAGQLLKVEFDGDYYTTKLIGPDSPNDANRISRLISNNGVLYGVGLIEEDYYGWRSWNGEIAQINLKTGKASTAKTFFWKPQFNWAIDGLDFGPDGVLYGIGRHDDLQGNLHAVIWKVDPATGKLEVLREIASAENFSGNLAGVFISGDYYNYFRYSKRGFLFARALGSHITPSYWIIDIESGVATEIFDECPGRDFCREGIPRPKAPLAIK